MDAFATFNDAYVKGFGAHRPARSTVAVRELVFFGRLETRKGVVEFMEAVERVLGGHVPGLGAAEAAARLRKVTFLGRTALVHGQLGVHYVQQRARAWPVAWGDVARGTVARVVG